MRLRINAFIYAIAVFNWVLVQCGDTRFFRDGAVDVGQARANDGPGNRDEVPAANDVSDRSYSFACNELLAGKKIVAVQAQPGQTVKVSVEGEFCPYSIHQLSVMMVIDISGSTGLHHRNGVLHSGSDPQVNQTCGRLEAAKSLYAFLDSQRQFNDQIEVAMIPFAGNVLRRDLVQFVRFEDFKKNLTPKIFCQYAITSASFAADPVNPGGIDMQTQEQFGINASTNYRAAFDEALLQFQKSTGRRILYFISDGEPTSGGKDPLAEGITAADKLRNGVANLTVNGLFLGAYGEEARQRLIKVIGSEARVQFATQAQDLAKDILEFPEVVMDLETGSANLFQGNSNQEGGFQSFSLVHENPPIWRFVTNPLPLHGAEKQILDNLLVIEAWDLDHARHRYEVQFNYQLIEP